MDRVSKCDEKGTLHFSFIMFCNILCFMPTIFEESSSSSIFCPTMFCFPDNIFQSGQTYNYKYFGKAETGLGFGDSKFVGLAVDCKIQLTVPEPCEYSLRVNNEC